MEKNQIINNYFKKSGDIFKFLETDFDYIRTGSEIKNESYYPDAEAILNYSGNKVAIKVFWNFAGALIGVVFIELQNGQLPEKISFWGNGDYGRAISLYSLINVINTEESKHFLLKNYYSVMFRDIKKREKIINENMEQVLENLAIMTKKYALDVLRGDTSIFPKIQAYEEELMKQNYRSNK